MIVALRLGHVHETTLKGILEQTSKRADKKIQWTHPERPVICAVPQGANSPLDTPASGSQLNNNVKDLALNAGIVERATHHSLKRGVARAMAHINEHIAGVATAAVQLALHHSDVTLHSGGTRDYVGDSQVLTYNIRAKHRFDDHLAPQMAPAPIQATRNTPKEVLEYMKKHGMDESQRILAAATLKREKLDAAKAAAHEQSEQTASSTVPAPKHDLGRGKTLLFPHASQGGNPRERCPRRE